MYEILEITTLAVSGGLLAKMAPNVVQEITKAVNTLRARRIEEFKRKARGLKYDSRLKRRQSRRP